MRTTRWRTAEAGLAVLTVALLALAAGCATEPAAPPPEQSRAPEGTETMPPEEPAPPDAMGQGTDDAGEGMADESTDEAGADEGEDDEGAAEGMGSDEPDEATQAAAPDPNMAPLPIELPKPQFTGTPKNIKFGGHVEKPSSKPRPPAFAPQGVKNVALGKPVTSSEQAPLIGELEQVADGDKEGVEGSYVELGPGLQWVQIDLKQVYEIYGILLWHYHGEAQVYHDVVIQVADDPDFIENVRTVYNNDYDNSAGLGLGSEKEYLETHEGRLIRADGLKARYVRLYSNGNTSNEFNRYTEVEVYGREPGT